MRTYDTGKDTTEARQGNRRTMNLRVLLLSGMAIVVAFAVVYIAFQVV